MEWKHLILITEQYQVVAVEWKHPILITEQYQVVAVEWKHLIVTNEQYQVVVYPILPYRSHRQISVVPHMGQCRIVTYFFSCTVRLQ